MAIKIEQFPTSPGMTNSDYLFEVTSSQATQPQFQFVADLTLSGSSTVLQRIKQQPNPSGYGVFNFGQVIASYLEEDKYWRENTITGSINTAKRFQVKFGEEYGTSVSSSVILYTGYGPSGNPAVTASSYYYVSNGLVDPYDAVNWNFPSASYFTANQVDLVSPPTFSLQNALTNAPITQSIQDGEYATISLFNGNFNNSSTLAQDILSIEFYVYDATGSEIANYNLKNEEATGGGPRDGTGNQLWSQVYTSQSAYTQLLTFGVGPQNINDYGVINLSTLDWTYYDVYFYGSRQSAGLSVTNYSGSYASYRFVKQGPACGYDGVRFAWKNEFGVWDYYTFTLQSDSSFNIERNSFGQTFVDYSTTSTTVAYSRERRGATQFYNGLDQTQTANSDWLTQEEADWLKELFFSANVYIQAGNGFEFLPVVISSANVVEKTNPRTQKTFQYQIEFKPANQLRPRI